MINRVICRWLVTGVTALGFSGCSKGGEDPHLDILERVSSVVSNYRNDVAKTSSLTESLERTQSYDMVVGGLVEKLQDRSGGMDCNSEVMSEGVNRMRSELDRHIKEVTDSSTLEKMQEDCRRHGKEMDHLVEECEGMHGGMMNHGM